MKTWKIVAWLALAVIVIIALSAMGASYAECSERGGIMVKDAFGVVQCLDQARVAVPIR